MTAVSTGSPAIGSAAGTIAPAASSRPADAVMTRLLRIPEQPPSLSMRTTHRLFSTGIVLSALRCLLTYVFLPIVAPLLGVAAGVGPAVGLPLAVVALGFDVVGMRRFWIARHRQRWAMTGIYAAVMGLVVALMVLDIVHLTR